jgi:bifunctional enzyme CysN/CysC
MWCWRSTRSTSSITPKSGFEEIRKDFETFASGFDFESLVAIPMSARFGDNVTAKARTWAGMTGPTLLEHLEDVEVGEHELEAPFRFPVQWVNRPNLDFRGYSGTIASGRVAVGDELVVAGPAKASKSQADHRAEGRGGRGPRGRSRHLTLQDEIDISRGDLLSARLPVRMSRTRWPRTSSGCRTTRCCRAGPIC